MKYERFEDIPVWRDAIALSVEVFKLTEDKRLSFKGDIANQLQRTALSYRTISRKGSNEGLHRS